MLHRVLTIYPLSISRGVTAALIRTVNVLAMDAVEKASPGHPGMPMGMGDVATVFFSNYLAESASAFSTPKAPRDIRLAAQDPEPEQRASGGNALTEEGRALQHKAGCLSDTLLAASTQTPQELATLNRDVRHLRNAIYSQIGG